MVQRTATDGIELGTDQGWWARTVGGMRHAVMPGEAGESASPARGTGAHESRSPMMASLARLLPRLVLVGAIGLLAFAVLLFAFRAVYADKVYPAVVVGDVPVGGKTIDQAVAAVEQRAEELETGTVTFTYGGQTWTPTLRELGATVDVDGSVEAAYALGRDDNAVERLGFTNALLQDDQQVPLRTTVDRQQLAGWFAQVNAEMDQRAVDATLVVEGTEVRIEPEHTGTIVDEAAATQQILQSLETLEPMSAELPTVVEQPQIFASDLEDGRARVAAALDGPIVAVFENQKWDLPPTDLVQFLTVDVSGSGEVEMTLDRAGLSQYLRTTFSGQVNRTPKDGHIAWRTGDGLIALEPSVDGVTLRSNAFADVVAESFLSDQSNVEVPVLLTHPQIDTNNLAALKINSLLGRGDSNYDGGKWDRDTNIEVATNLLNGTLIAPGETFSFNGAIGEITADKGYVEAGVIAAETIGRDVGGGVCQVSTTVFRATLLAGLPITEWWAHSMRLHGYERDGWPAGFDASILQSGSDPQWWGDFKFQNDTGGYVLVQSWTDYPHVIVEIYGNDDGRQVELSDSGYRELDQSFQDREVVDASKSNGYMVQTEWPKPASVAWFTRTISYADGSSVDRTFESEYEGSGNVWVVSPDMKGDSPGAN